MTYATLEPFGEDRADLRSGIISSVIANVNRDPSKPVFKPLDFMPDYGGLRAEEESRSSQPLTSVEEWSKVLSVARTLGEEVE